ncbi:unnamed protein product [Porites evermanni]|uniref:F5/8 type C domain-containing protein n=1 Tax=Porites evermanni TaxID=104178 RepID=A0ABN8M7P9_9CNID|nr:unnamed protein product [Porites evermanni]
MWDTRHGPWRARLNQLNRGGAGAWSTRYNNVAQWLHIDLGEVSKVVAVATQGRYDANQWVKKYKISYSVYGRLLLERLIAIVMNCLFFQMFPGNSDRNTVVYNRLYPSFKSRFVRIYPKQWHGHISMRVELYGCNSGR